MKNNIRKSVKRWLALAMTAIMVFAMATTVMAAITPTTDTYTLTVTKQKDYDANVTYDVYQLFTANIDDDGNALYEMNADAAALFGTKTVDEVAGMSSADLYKLVKELTLTTGLSDLKLSTQLTTGTAYTITTAGYYLLVPNSLAGTSQDEGGTVSSVIFVAVPGVKSDGAGGYTVEKNVEVESKSSDVSTDKAITDVTSINGNQDTFSDSGDTATSGEGDTIQYTITNTVPTYTSDVDPAKVNYYVVDTYDENLTIVDDSVTVTSPTLTAGSGYKTETVTALDGTSTYTLYTVEGGDYYVVYGTNNTFTVYFNYSSVKEASDVVITANFTLDETATPGTAVNNKSELTYTNNYYTGKDATLKSEVNSYTFGLEVYKYDTKDNTAISGAKFGLYSDVDCQNKIADATSDGNGIVDFDVLLNDGTYYVKEIDAPSGYRIDETVYTVVISATKDQTTGEYTGAATFTAGGGTISSTLTLDETSAGADDGKTVNTGNTAIAVMGIGNTAGTTLPGTGGIGTTIFTFGGLALVIIAAIMFIVYTKKQRKQA